MERSWMTDDNLDLMEQRCNCRKAYKYKGIGGIRITKWYTKECKEIEDYESKYDLFNLKKIKHVTTSSNPLSPSQYLKDKNGNKIES